MGQPVAPDLSAVSDLSATPDLREPKDMVVHRDLETAKDLSDPKDMSQCPLCSVAECAADTLACTTQAEKDKLKACHSIEDDAKGQEHSFCHKTNPICRCP